MSQTNQGVMMDVLWDHQGGRFRQVALVVAGSLLLTLSAKFQVPFYPVPMTLQPLVVLMLGVVLGAKLGGAAVLFYLLQGAMGFPVFAGTPEKGLGLMYMTGPTGGYLVGFLVAAYVTGVLAERGLDRSRVGTLVAMVAGMGVIYALGLLWLGVFVGYNQTLLNVGLYPFVLGDAVKIALASVSVPMIWAWLKK